MKFEVSKVLQIPNESRDVPSHSRQDPGFLRKMREEGWQTYDRGSGWATLYKPAQIILIVRRETEKNLRCDVAPFFKEHFGRMTQKRINAICATAPKLVELSVNGKLPGSRDLEEWLTLAKSALKMK